MKSNKQKFGFVLLMVLVILAIGATVLGTCAYHHSRKALAAGALRNRIQLKWGTIALKTAFVDQAGELMDECNKLRNDESENSQPFIEKQFYFGGLDWKVILADEQAKVNINQLAALAGGNIVASRVKKLQNDSGVPLKIKPKIAEILQKKTKFSNPQEFFEYSHPSELVGEDFESSPLKRITFWSSGELNFKMADSDSITVLMEGILNDTDIQQISEIRKTDPDISLANLIKKLTLEDKQLVEVKQNLTDKSKAYSLWVIADEKTRKNYRLFIRSNTEEETKVWSYQW